MYIVMRMKKSSMFHPAASPALFHIRIFLSLDTSLFVVGHPVSLKGLQHTSVIGAAHFYCEEPHFRAGCPVALATTFQRAERLGSPRLHELGDANAEGADPFPVQINNVFRRL